jgi:hypothetical protein
MRPRNWNEYTLNPLTRINWRASLVPAAAVIPASIAYIKVVAVKKLVVGSQELREWFAFMGVTILSSYLVGVRLGALH